MLRLLVIVGLLCLPGLSRAGTPTPVATVIVFNFGYNPATTSINQGDTVLWTNTSGLPHNVQPTPGSEPAANGASGSWTYEYTFNNAGSFPYFCVVHGAASMSGVVHVTPAVPTATPTQTPTFSASPTSSETPTATETFTQVPPGSTGTTTPTVSPSLTVSPTASISPTPTRTRTPGPIQFSNDRTVLAPAPLRQGEKVCAYYSAAPAYSHWTVYNAAGERVTRLNFSNESPQCWDSAGIAPGIYFFRVEAQLPDGSLQVTRQKIAVLKP